MYGLKYKSKVMYRRLHTASVCRTSPRTAYFASASTISIRRLCRLLKPGVAPHTHSSHLDENALSGALQMISVYYIRYSAAKHSHRMQFPPILTMKSDHTAFVRLPLNLTDSDAVTREKYPSKLSVPTAVTPGIKELLSAKLEESKEHAKQVEALRCENTNLKQKIEELQEQLVYMRAKAATASPPAEKVQMIDQEVDATEGNLTEQIAQLREDMRELRVEKKTMQVHVSQQQDALWALRDASANDNTTACMDLYVNACRPRRICNA